MILHYESNVKRSGSRCTRTPNTLGRFQPSNGPFCDSQASVVALPTARRVRKTECVQDFDTERMKIEGDQSCQKSR